MLSSDALPGAAFAVDSLVLAARDNGFRAKEQSRIVLDTVGRYRTAMADFAAMKQLEAWYSHLLTDLAHKVVGVGSVGTRAWIALMLGRDGQDPLFLQVKDAEASVLQEFLGPSEFSDHGERVVVGQRLMQATSDIVLGWLHVDAGVDGKPRDFYARR